MSQQPNPMPQLVTDHLKKPKSRSAAPGNMPLGNYFARTVRPLLPIAWQYGIKWNLLAYAARGFMLFGVFVLGKSMLYDPYTVEGKKKVPKYEFVKDNSGKVVSMAPPRIVRQIDKARERSAHWRSESENS
jgi:hypothetical protein